MISHDIILLQQLACLCVGIDLYDLHKNPVKANKT